jgi:hypothetical protein
MITASPQPAASADASPDPIEDVSLTSYELAFGVATVLGAEHRAEIAELRAEHRAELAELRAEIAGLKKAGNEPDLDAMPPRGGPLKRVCEVVHCTGWSETRIRSWARAGVINSQYFGGRLFIDERGVPVKKRKS